MRILLSGEISDALARIAFAGLVGSNKIVTPAVNPRFIELLRFDIQSTGQKSRCVNTLRGPSQRFVLIRQSDSLSPCQF